MIHRDIASDCRVVERLDMFLHSFTLSAPYQQAGSRQESRSFTHFPISKDVFLHSVLLVSHGPKDAAKSLEFEANRDAETPFAAREEAEGVRILRHHGLITPACIEPEPEKILIEKHAPPRKL